MFTIRTQSVDNRNNLIRLLIINTDDTSLSADTLFLIHNYNFLVIQKDRLWSESGN